MAAGATYEPIATQTLGSSAATVTFSSISGAYTDLKIIFTGVVGAGGDAFYLRFNGDSATNYSNTELKGNGTAASSARYSSVSYMYACGNGLSTIQTNVLVDINNYSNTTTYKTALFRYNDTNNVMAATVGLWRSTAAITSISINSLGSYTTGSTFTLYGIAAA